jgi:hypothetical protein
MMGESRKVMDHEDQVVMHDLFEALTDFIGEKDVDMNVIMHALCRTIAFGGVQLNRHDEVTKRHFVSMVVESVSAHYDHFVEMIQQHGEHDD